MAGVNVMALGNMKKIKLNEYAVTKDGEGNNIEQLVNSYPIWAEVKETSGNRSFDNGVNLNKSKTFRIWFKPDWVLTGNWIIRYFGRDYTIENIERVNEKRFNWIVSANG